MLAAIRQGKVLALNFQNTSTDNVKVQLLLAGCPETITKL
jgi:hypothetical protein